MYLNDIYTIPANLAGLPGMSIPCGFGRDNLPVGLHIVGNYFSEAKMLNVAHQYQKATDWHKRERPPGFSNELEIRHRPRDARAALDRVEDVLRCIDRVRRAAEYPGERRGHRAAGRAAGREPRRGRARDPFGLRSAEKS